MGGQERGTNLTEDLVKSILKQGRHMTPGRLKQEIFKEGDQGYSMEVRMAIRGELRGLVPVQPG